MNIVVITGLSGAGKTTAVQCLEDLGYYCVDNLPPTLIPKFAELCSQAEGKINRVALVIDIRGRKFFDSLSEALHTLDQQGYRYQILFLEASDEVLVRRFKESRRRHPLAPLGRVLEGIAVERQWLQELRGRASKIIDTSNLSVQQLKEQVIEIFGAREGVSSLMVTVVSFGYKYGIPMDADLVFDVRFLPNPFYIRELREHTGLEKEVRDFVLGQKVTQLFLRRFTGLLNFLLPLYIKEGKSHLGIAVGCTGGQHRSVVLAGEIGKALERQGYQVIVKHRDLPRETARREAGEAERVDQK